MKNLDKRLEAWLSVSLISKDQAEAIRRYESEQPSSRWILYGILSLGIFVLAMGIISLIAANWNAIPGYVKLLVDFTLLTFLGIGVYAVSERKALLREGSIFGFILLVLASIGLISQVYQVSGELPDALVFWGTITFPIVLMSRNVLTSAVWCFLVIASLYYQAMDIHISSTLASRTERFFSVMALMPVAIGAGYMILNKLKAHQSFLTAIVMSLLVGFMFSLWVADFNVTFPDVFHLRWEHKLFWYWIGGGVLCAIVGILYSDELSKVQRALLFFAILLNALLYVLLFHPTDWRILGAVISIASTLMLMLFFGSRRDFVFYHLTALLVGFRFILLYMTELGGLIRTGFGLIITGLLIISMVWLWQRHQNKLARWLGEYSR